MTRKHEANVKKSKWINFQLGNRNAKLFLFYV